MMEVSKKKIAWEPITPPGVAAFADASVARVLFVQLIVALFAASVTVWFLKTAWYPVVTSAIQQLPAQGEIRDGKLNWPAESPVLLADGNFLAIIVDLDHEGQMRSPAHVQVEFGRNDVRVFSLFGYQQFPYSPEYIISFNRPELEPKWGAWRPPILWITFGAVAAGLMVSWTALATVYFFPLWLVGFFANRRISLGASWKIAGAALMPGALLLIATIIFYGLGFIDLVQLTAAFAAHFVIGWIYLVASPWFIPKIEEVATIKKNPFEKK
jgi:hypothetical protein